MLFTLWKKGRFYRMPFKSLLRVQIKRTNTRLFSQWTLLWKNSFGKVGKKVCPVGCVSLGLTNWGCLSLVLINWDSQQGRPFSLLSQRNFPISFKPKVAKAEFFWKMQRKNWYFIFGLDAMPLSLKNLLLRKGNVSTSQQHVIVFYFQN